MSSASPVWGLSAIISIMLAVTGCGQERASPAPFASYSDSAYFVDNNDVSVQITAIGTAGPKRLMGTSSLTEDYWRVFWTLDQLDTAKPNRPRGTAYIGHYERGIASQFFPNRAVPRTSGLPLTSLAHTGPSQGLLWNDSRYLSIKLPVTSQPALLAEKADDGKHRLTLTRSHQHIFVRGSKDVILNARDFTEEKTLPATATFQKFLQQCDETALAGLFLTDDLRFLVAIPHNGGDPRPGFNHFRAWCYEIDTDRLEEHQLHFGEKVTQIIDAELIGDRLLFMVANEAHKRAILDPKSEIVFDLAGLAEFLPTYSRILWDYRRDRVLAFPADFSKPATQMPELQMTEFNYASNRTRKYALRIDSLTLP